MKPNFFLCAVIIFGGSFVYGKSKTINGVTILENKGLVSIENHLLILTYDLEEGTYSAFSKIEKSEIIYNASSKINDFMSSAKGTSHSYKIEPINDNLGKGAAFLIVSKKDGFPDQLLRITVYSNQAFVAMKIGIVNTLKKSYIIKSFAPISNASIYKNENIIENFRLLDGEGGGGATSIRKCPNMLSQNNMILNFGTEKKRHTLVAGGLTYSEFEKYAYIREDGSREKELSQVDKKLSLLEYIDFGVMSHLNKNKYNYILQNKNYNIYYYEQFLGSYPEAKSVIYDGNEISLKMQNLNSNKSYVLGLVWGCDNDYTVRKQSVHLVSGGVTRELLKSSALPNLKIGEPAQIIYIPITSEIMKQGMPSIVIKKEEGVNCVLSEAALFEGEMNEGKYLSPQPILKIKPSFENLKLDIFAEDPVGKLVIKTNTYFPQNDAFYLDFTTPNPIIAAEQYSQTIKKANNVKLNFYYFPTICLWYAMQPGFGGGNKSRATNDSPGAVEEMEHVKKSGWLKYTTMAIRLVPDCYDNNNENGWFDDKHWQMYGSGSLQENEIKLEKGHYRKPYETSKKWAQTVKGLGGLPFMYFQTNVRSNDYCEKYPSHMLHNQSYFKVVGQMQDWPNKGFGGYDFTDKNFSEHMKNVYKNLFKAGIAGIMYDYAVTGWAFYGGMDDIYSTAGGMFRKIFQLASSGLGNTAYIDERNLVRGSDITVGLAESQRIWADTDVLTPEMVMRSGLRWYKNRVLFNYDMDAKNLLKASPYFSDDGINKLLTMSYVAGSRLLLANSFANLNETQIHKLSRVFPYHKFAKSSRPINAFSSDYPDIYDFEINANWHQLTLYNENETRNKNMEVSLSGSIGYGGMGLDKMNDYYLYDFWNNQFIGKLSGESLLTQNLRKGEARMISVHKVEKNPQVISTDRHLMQGYIELSDIKWTNNSLCGKADLVPEEPMRIIIATNGKIPKSAKSTKGTTSLKLLSNDLTELTLMANQKGKIQWKINFGNSK